MTTDIGQLAAGDPGTRLLVPLPAAEPAPADVFPLPVTPLEYYYLCDDRPDYPATYLFELTFSGALEPAPLAAAIGAALARHPLLAASIDWNDGGRPNWVAGRSPAAIDWAAADVPLAHAGGERIDLAKSGGLRAWVRTGDGGARLSLQFHHAAADALGACQFMEDVLIEYHAHFAAGFRQRLRPLDPARLPKRDSFGVDDPRWRPTWGERWRTVCHWTRLLARPPIALAEPGTPPDVAPAYLQFVDHVFDREATGRLRAAAAGEEVTLNDLLLRDLVLTLAEWNAAHGRRGRLRINVPTNLRSRQDAALPAANVIGFAFLDRRVGRRADPARLLSSIARETSAIKRDRQGLLFLGGLGFACGRPGLVPWMLARRRSFATAMLSNLGKLFVRTPLPRASGKLVAGEAVLERVSGAPPIRPLTRAGLVALDYNRQLTITLRCDRASFSRAESRALLERFVARLERSSADAARLPRKPR